ncbi:MAG: hypothetical protein FWD71_03670 [Oscillospiraceae bacterium]|nr:hypothetical protein [Oscillospiraceae bacterium]
MILLYRSINLNVEINAAFIKGDNTFRYFHQKDKRWKRIKYGNSTIGNAGCGVAVLSMIHSVPDQNITPGQSAVWICENFQINIGTNTDVMISYLNNIGLENTYLPRNINLLAELKNNAVMCVLVRNKLAKINKLLGYAENHFILLYDIIGDKCRVADPENYSKSLKLRKLRILLKDVNRLPSNITYPYISVRF